MDFFCETTFVRRVKVPRVAVVMPNADCVVFANNMVFRRPSFGKRTPNHQYKTYNSSYVLLCRKTVGKLQNHGRRVPAPYFSVCHGQWP
jgi:hypothetical protein